jgi:serine/threonine protein kinase
MQRHTFNALNSTFIVDSEYEFVKELGQGAYGCVVAAKHRRSGEGCAIKKISNINTKRILTKRCLREIKYVSRLDRSFPPLIVRPRFNRLLHHFRGHKNVGKSPIRPSKQISHRERLSRLHAFTTWIWSSNQMGISTKFIYMSVFSSSS